MDRKLFAIEVIQENGAVEVRMPFFRVKCKNPNCDAIPVTPYYTSHTKPEEIKSSMTGCGPIQITCHECGRIDTYFRGDFRVTARWITSSLTYKLLDSLGLPHEN